MLLKKSSLCSILFMVLCLCLVPIAYGQATFSEWPTVTDQGSTVNITFAVSAATDVEVAILDAAGSIVRHLAAGVLGGTYAPPAPLSQGLSQSLTWDKKDDSGNTAAGGPFKVRVRIGLKSEYQYAINTKTIPGSHLGSYTVPKLWEETVTLLNPIFNRILVLHSNPDLFMQVNKAYDEVYIHVTNVYSIDQYRYSCADGSLLGIVNFGTAHERQYWGEIAFTPDGESIIHTTSLAEIFRYSRLGQAAQWPGGSVSNVTGFQQGFTNARGHAIGPDGSCYVLHHHLHCGGIYQGDSTYKGGVVSKIGPSGNKEKVEFITLGTYVGGGIGVDPAGNIYVGAAVKPGGKAVPDGVAALAPNTGSESLGWWAEQMYGSIIKYTPSGTKVWEYFGQSPASLSKPNPPRGTHCVCNVSRFDIDGFGRIFLPDAFRISVVALDNNRNEIMRFNHKPILEMKKVPFAWPHAIEVTDKAIFVGDQINDQVICLALKADQESLVDATGSIEQGGVFKMASSLRINPNPVQTVTQLRFHLKERKTVSLCIYNVQGALLETLVDREMEKGGHVVNWKQIDFKSGIYLARLILGDQVYSKRFIVIK
jgi:hypothetical protein